MDTAQQEIEEQLKELMDLAVEKVTDSITGMVDKVTESEDEASGARELLEPLFDQLEGFLGPLTGGIEGVKSAASSVGASFG
jgi:hypothetical protein